MKKNASAKIHCYGVAVIVYLLQIIECAPAERRDVHGDRHRGECHDDGTLLRQRNLF